MPSRNKKKIKNPDGTWSKRPAKPQIVKRKQVQDADGWTHVVGPHQQKIQHETTNTNVVHIERGIHEMSTQHEKMMNQWQDSETRKILRDEIAGFKTRENRGVGKIVCLGLGTLSNGNFTQQNNRHAQLAALMDVVNLLGGSEQLTMVAQDPIFGPCDKSFLEFLGFQVLESPGAFEAIGRDALVYAVHCSEEIYEEVAKAERPAIMIGNDIKELCDSRNVSVVLKPLAEDYKEISVEPVLSKRKERTDHFDQIFYSAFYATRLYLRLSPNPPECLQDTILPEEKIFQAQIRGGLLLTEQDLASEENLEENLEVVKNQDSSEEGNVPLDQRSTHPPFQIYEDPTPPEVIRPSQETPTAEASENVPEADGHPDVERHPEVEGHPEVSEHPEVEGSEGEMEAEEDSEFQGDSDSQGDSAVEDDDISEFWDDAEFDERPEFDEDKENRPPPNGIFKVEDYARQREWDLANRRNSIHNWVPGLRLNNLPTFHTGHQEGFGFIFVQHLLTKTPPLS